MISLFDAIAAQVVCRKHVFDRLMPHISVQFVHQVQYHEQTRQAGQTLLLAKVDIMPLKS